MMHVACQVRRRSECGGLLLLDRAGICRDPASNLAEFYVAEHLNILQLLQPLLRPGKHNANLASSETHLLV